MRPINRGILVALLVCAFLVAVAGVPAMAAEIKDSANQPKDAIAGGLEDIIPPFGYQEDASCQSDCCWASCTGDGCSVSCSNSECSAESGGASASYICDIGDQD